MRKAFVKLICGLVSIAMMSCSVRNASPIVHQKPVDPTVEQKPTAPDHTLDVPGLPATASALDAGQKPEAVLAQRIVPLANVLFSPRVADSAAVYDDKFFDLLREFYDHVIYVNQQNHALLKNSGVLDKLQAAVFKGCPNLQDQCPYLKVYGREAHMNQVLEILAQNNAENHGDLLQYYTILKAAYERSSAAPDQNLILLYLERARSLSDFYSRQINPETGHVQGNARDALIQHTQIVQNMLQNFDPTQDDPARVQNLMTSFKWDISRKNPDLLAFGLLPFAAQTDLYDKDGKLSPDFVTSVSSSIFNQSDSNKGLGAWAIANYIIDGNFSGDHRQNGNSKAILRNFAITDANYDVPKAMEVNEYSYLVDRLFYSHFTTADADAFWAKTHQDRAAFFKAINQFVKMQIAYRIVNTNESMNKFFDANVDDKGRPKFGDILGLLQQAVANSLALHADWDLTLTRVNTLMNYVDHVYGSQDVLKIRDPNDPYKVLTESISSLQQNIKMLSVYPNMMMLVYLMAKENFQATIQTFWGTTFSITADKIIEWFFIDVLAPWFSFGTDNTPLTQVELLYAMHFTMQTETFSAFKNNRLLQVDAASFFREITNKLTNDMVQSMKDANTSVTSSLTLNHRQWDDAIAACAEERVKQPQEAAAGHLLPRDYHREIGYKSMLSQLANGFNSHSTGSPMWAISAYYTAGRQNDVNKMLIFTRNDLRQRLLALENMKSILVTYLKQTGGDVDGVLKAYDQELSKLTDARDAFLLTLENQNARLQDCDLLLYKHELDLRNELYRREAAYLGSVYDNLQQMQKPAPPGEALQKSKNDELASSHVGDPGLSNVYIQKGGYDRYQKNARGYYYDYYKFDALLRARKTLQDVSGGSTVIRLPDFDSSTIDEYQAPVPHSMALADLGSRQDFIDDGMRQFVVYMGLEDGDAILPDFVPYRLDIMAELYRLGGSDASTGKLGCEPGKDGCTGVLPRQLIDYTMRVTQLIGLSDQDKQVLKWTGQPQKYKDDFWTELAMEPGTRRPLGLLDVTFQRVVSDGDAQDGTVTSTLLDGTQTYYDTATAVENFLFQPQQVVKDQVMQNYKDLVVDYFAKTDAFLKAYREFQLEDPYQIQSVQRSTDALGTIPVNRETVNGKTVNQYLTPMRLSRYTSLVNTFNNRTEYKFAN